MPVLCHPGVFLPLLPRLPHPFCCTLIHELFIFNHFFYFFYIAVIRLFITTQETQSVLSISISFATKFWTYVTSLVYYLPQTYSVTSYLVYVISSVTMWRMFYRVVTSDPGVVRRTEGEKKQVGKKN